MDPLALLGDSGSENEADTLEDAGDEVEEGPTKRAKTEGPTVGFDDLQLAGFKGVELCETERYLRDVAGQEQRRPQVPAPQAAPAPSTPSPEEEPDGNENAEEEEQSIPPQPPKVEVRLQGLQGTVPTPLTSFRDSRPVLPTTLQQPLQELGFDIPTPIQANAIPIIATGRDLVGISATGSGKTLAYLLPCFASLLRSVCSNPSHAPRMLVLGPTRELVAQIQRSSSRFCKSSGLLLETIYGGASKAEQLAGLRKMPPVVVATPGRLLEFLEEEPPPCSLRHVKHLVLDEADRMLGEGFDVQVRKIVAEAKLMNRQTLLFSATWPPSVQAFASSVLREPVEVRVGVSDATFSTNPNVVQDVMFLRDDWEKPGALCALLRGRKNVKAIVFVATKRACQQLERSLRGRVPLVCDAIHGDRSQRDREAVLDRFRKGDVQVLLATDVAGRGIDVSNVTLVVNYDSPRSAEDYIHRIGRTGRQGRGVAISILTDREQESMELIANVVQKAGTRMPPELAKRLGMLTAGAGKVDPRMHWKEPWEGLDGNKYQKEDLKSAVESLWT